MLKTHTHSHKNFYTSAFIALVVFVGACAPKDKLATVGDEVISQQKFENYLKAERINIKDESHRDAVLKSFLEREALAQAALKAGLQEDGLLEAKIREYRKEIIISSYIDKYLANAVNEESLKNYYNAHTDKFEDQTIHVAHILVRTSNNMSPAQRKAKLTTAQEAYSKIKAGESFSEIANRYSEDTVSGNKGGDLGWLSQGSIDKQFSDKIFAMKAGDISEPFETKFGFHIAKIIAGPKVNRKTFEAVKGNIRYQLRKEVRESEMKKMLSTIAIKIND